MKKAVRKKKQQKRPSSTVYEEGACRTPEPTLDALLSDPGLSIHDYMEMRDAMERRCAAQLKSDLDELDQRIGVMGQTVRQILSWIRNAPTRDVQAATLAENQYLLAEMSRLRILCVKHGLAK